MSTIVHLADLHLGFSHLNSKAEDGRNQRMVDFERSALLCAEHIVENIKPVAAVVAGDMCHQPQLYPPALSGAVAFCERFREAGIPLIAIGGNHDEAESAGRFNALRFLAKHHGLKLHLQQDYLDIDHFRLHLVSFRILSRAAQERGKIQPFSFAADKNNILVTHGYAPGNNVAEIPEDRDVLIPSEWLYDPRFDLVMLGHVHKHVKLLDDRPVFYAGSTERRNFGESSEQPGFWVHHFEQQSLQRSESVLVKDLSDSLPRKMLDFHLDCAQLTVEQLDKKVRKLMDKQPIEGAMMRCVLDNVSAELDRQQSRNVWGKEFKKRDGLYFEASTRSRQMAELMDINFAKAPVDVGQGLLQFINEQQFESDAQKKQVSKLAESIVAEAKEVILSQEND